MPSRAVQKRKAKKEAKRLRSSQEGSDHHHILSQHENTRSDEGGDNRQLKRRRIDAVLPPAVATAVPTPEIVVVAAAAPARANTASLVSSASVTNLPATSPTLPSAAAALSRKDRKRQLSQQKHERQLMKLSRSVNAVTDTNTNGGAQPCGTNSATSAPANGTSDPSLTQAPQRHDPRNAGGTFWRSRKEIKKRTLFVGNLPAGSSPASITDLVDSVVSSNSLGDAGPSVEKVDLLKGHARARVTHAFVTFRTAEVSAEAQRLLDGLQVGSNFLRVNGAADKQQRAEAISRRQGGFGATSSRLPVRRT